MKIKWIGTLLTVLVLGACGNLSDENSVWNRLPEVEEMDVAVAAGGGAGSFTPGVFVGESVVRGYSGFVTVEVTVGDDGQIAAIEVTDHRESDGFYQRAFDNVIPLIIGANSPDVNIDVASGATYSASALVDAVSIALADAGGVSGVVAPASLTPGVFEATSEVRGYNGFVTVLVTVGDNGLIESIEVTEHRESEGFYQRAFDNLIPLIMGSGSTDVDIDVASGATYSASALIDAVSIALESAR